MTINPSVARDSSTAEKVLKQLISKPGKSSSKLLKDPAATTATSWHLCLPPHFNYALDLRFSQKQKIKNKKVVQTWKEWVQGGKFQFNEGSIIYNKDVSQIKMWGDKLSIIDLYILVKSSRPVSLRVTKDEFSRSRTIHRDPGLVTFLIFLAPDFSRDSTPEEISMTQDQFVQFAITGKH